MILQDPSSINVLPKTKDCSSRSSLWLWLCKHCSPNSSAAQRQIQEYILKMIVWMSSMNSTSNSKVCLWPSEIPKKSASVTHGWKNFIHQFHTFFLEPIFRMHITTHLAAERSTYLLSHSSCGSGIGPLLQWLSYEYSQGVGQGWGLIWRVDWERIHFHVHVIVGRISVSKGCWTEGLSF